MGSINPSNGRTLILSEASNGWVLTLNQTSESGEYSTETYVANDTEELIDLVEELIEDESDDEPSVN